MLVREKGLLYISIRWNPRIKMMIPLPKDYQHKHSIISGSYLQDGDGDYLKAREIEKMAKYY